MHINTDPESFVPKDFTILNFYGRSDMCFAWNKDEFVYFQYSCKSSTEVLKVWKAPAEINDFRSFGGRIFILCIPSGIYKLTENFAFAILSKSGIELGLDYSEVFAPINGKLVLEDKREKNSKNLFALSVLSDINVLALYFNNIDISLRKVLLPSNYKNDANLCLISHDKNLYKMSEQIVQIIYSCDYIIEKIHAIEKHGKIIGAILQTGTNVVILMHVIDNKLKYNNIFLKTNAKRICPVIDDTNMENVLFLIYSDNVRTYYAAKVLNEDSCQEIRTEEIHYESFRVYQSKFVVFLNDSKELLQIGVGNLKDGYDHNVSNYTKLKLNMLKDLENIHETICSKTTELKDLKEELQEKEDTLKRINLYVNKQHIKYCPDDTVIRLLNQVFLTSSFKNELPENSIIVKMLRNRGRSIFTMKNVKKHETTVEMPICISNLSSKIYTTTDLITYKNDGGVWCLIKNYVQDPLAIKNSKVHLTCEKRKFVKYKLIVLQEMMKEKNLSMEELAKLKRQIREEI